MSHPELTANASKLELRKALIQLRLELHRQQLRHETLLVVKPLQNARNLSQQWTSVLGKSSAPVLGAIAVGILAFVFVQRKQLGSWLTLGSALAPLLTQLLRHNSPEPSPVASAEPTASTATDDHAS
jgi:hypothetical protein